MSDQDKKERIAALWSEIYILKLYFESLKFRDTIIGRCVLVLSVSWIFVELAEGLHWFEILPAFVFIMLLYWITQNGYFATVTALLSMILENNFNLWSKNTETLTQKDIEHIERQRVLLTNYTAEGPSLRLLYFIHENRVKKLLSSPYRKYADSSRFREKLKPNCVMYMLAHFLPCEKYAYQKYRVMASIDDNIYHIINRQSN